MSVWQLTTGRKRATLYGHKDTVRKIVFLPDGRHFATAAKDKTVKLWDLPSLLEKIPAPPWPKPADPSQPPTTAMPRLVLGGAEGFERQEDQVAISPNGGLLAALGHGNYRFLLLIWFSKAGRAAKISSNRGGSPKNMGRMSR
jgi:WD40 repeat protein